MDIKTTGDVSRAFQHPFLSAHRRLTLLHPGKAETSRVVRFLGLGLAEREARVSESHRPPVRLFPLPTFSEVQALPCLPLILPW